ncbi:hypothetical protein B1C78_13975 [Thioalkalivibrio denitrificans]|uniref:VWFA domain-containing protein n=1 Tax=Thioalkalivibrio denitrificans TaxID=108003 RepID=A0A1V3NCH6_9GAMM|nr:hypothetical protein [Thioalkalivibrio denitrificans]OOG22780.1 hypothetical protein B1C78_13975 [Thioalkalivibrio denitrificans]
MKHISNRIGHEANRRIRLTVLGAAMMLAVMLAGCGQPANNTRAAFVLIDISRDYAGELEKARTLTNFLLGSLNSGDSIAIAFIDNSSFTARNMIARTTFDHRPSVTTRQKREVRALLDAFIERFRVPSHHSDITGGLLLAADHLEELGAGESYLFILSDLHEDLPPWLRRDMPVALRDVQVIAVNVKRQRRDNNDPQAYRERLASWQERIEGGGGQFRVVNDLARLDNVVARR